MYFKKMFIAVLVLILFSATACNAEKLSGFENEDALLSRGYPEAVLNSLNDSVKRSIDQDEMLTFSCALVTIYDTSQNVYSEYYITEDETVKVRDVGADVILNWVISETSDENIVDVKLTYEWLELPVLRGQDPISVSWDEEQYEIVTNSFFKVDMYGDGNEYYVNSSENGYAQANQNGVTWYADLEGSIPNAAKLNGYAEFQLRKKSSDEEKTSFNALYVHGMILGYEEVSSRIEY